MKNLFFTLILLSIFLVDYLKAQSPAPPDKICFDYDKAGNRVAQNPAWFSHYDANNEPVYIPDCQASENVPSSFGVSIIRIKKMSELDELLPILTNVAWVINGPDLSVGVWTSGPILVANDPWIVSNPNGVYGIVIDLDPSVKSTKNRNDHDEVTASIVPNPTEGEFEVVQRGFDVDQAELYIIDSKGALLFQRDFVNGQVNISDYPSGTYLLIIKDALRSKSVRFIKK